MQDSISRPSAHQFLIGIDVGTGSARAGVFRCDGTMLASDKHPISMFRSEGGMVEQSSNDIWSAVVRSVRGAVAASGVSATDIVGIGFDATCSLVVVGPQGTPLPVGDPNETERNIIVWMDHRAVEQAERINQTHHPVLQYVGGRISPEMETPKLLWLKENRPDVFAKAWQFFDLTDFLTWRATGDLTRSVCTVTCKWTYLAHEKKWDASYFQTVGLQELADEEFTRIGTSIAAPGTPLGSGLTKEAAAEMGLPVGIAVGTGLIDAHAGGIGSVGAALGGGAEANLAYIFGTSSCIMTTTPEPVFVPGVWGPYYNAMVPGAWLNEGGQSAAGAAIEQLLDFHPFSAEASQSASASGLALTEWLLKQVTTRVAASSDVVRLAGGVHVVPEFLGNRAPYADPNTRAVIAGLGMERDLNSLMSLYVAGLCGLGYGLRQIIEAKAEAGVHVKRIVISGGAGKSDLIRQILADSTGIEVAAPAAPEPVLLGSAILGALAAGVYSNATTAMEAMSTFAERYQPAKGPISAIHHQRYEVFKRLQATARFAASH